VVRLSPVGDVAREYINPARQFDDFADTTKERTHTLEITREDIPVNALDPSLPSQTLQSW